MPQFKFCFKPYPHEGAILEDVLGIFKGHKLCPQPSRQLSITYCMHFHKNLKQYSSQVKLVIICPYLEEGSGKVDYSNDFNGHDRFD